MKKTSYVLLIFLIGFVSNALFAQTVTVCSWNVRDFGKSKSDAELDFIASTIRDFDIIALQEVVAGDGGAQAVARLVDILKRKGNRWDYAVSPPTFSSSYKKERYAFIWKPSKVAIVGRPWLEQLYKIEIDREPFFGSFRSGKREFTLVNFHAITKSMQPETEVKYFKYLPAQYNKLNLIFCGDFNLPERHTVFNPLKSLGFAPALRGQKTSLKQECDGNDCLASEFDNFFFPKEKVKVHRVGVSHFYSSFPSLKEAKLISDHIPIFMEFSLN